MTRIYLPLTSAEVEQLVEQRTLPGDRTAHAVTEALVEAWPDGDQEGWEYAALMAAADESWLRRHLDDPPRRWVLAVEIDGEAIDASGLAIGIPQSGHPPTQVRVSAEIAWRSIAALHVDDQLQPVDTGPDDENDLAWFATQEIPLLVSQAWTRSHSLRLPPTSPT